MQGRRRDNDRKRILCKYVEDRFAENAADGPRSFCRSRMSYPLVGSQDRGSLVGWGIGEDELRVQSSGLSRP